MEAKREKQELFETMPIPRAYMTVTIPVVVSSMVTVIYNLADTFFVGMIGDPIENAAVTLVYPLMLAFYAINNLFGVGTSSMMSRCMGAGDGEKTKSCAAFGFYGALGSALVFSLICTVLRTPLLRMLGADAQTFDATYRYMFWTVCLGAVPTILNVVQSFMVRSEGSAMHASIGTMSGCILNIILDPIFILPWGLNMGAEGAGLATFVSNMVAMLYFVILSLTKGSRTYVSMDLRRLRHLSRDVVTGIMGVGLPASFQNLVNVLGTAILNNFAAAFGAAAVAAMGIASKLHQVYFQIMMGAGQGIMPLVGYNYTSGNRSRMKHCIRFSLSVTVPLGLLVSLVYWLRAPELVRLFMDNGEIVAYGTEFLRAMVFSMVPITVDFTTLGVFQALGMGKNSLIYALLRKVVMEIPLLFLLNRLWPLYGLPYAQVISECVLALVSIVMLRRIFRNSPDLPR